MDYKVKEVVTSASMNTLCSELRGVADEVFAQESLLRKILHRVSFVSGPEGQTAKIYMAHPQKVIGEIDQCNSLEASEAVSITVPRRDRGRHTYPRNRNDNSSL